MRIFLATVILGASAIVVVPSDASAQYPCNEACRQLLNPEGGHDGYACVSGTQGDGCVATIGWCQITTGGCPGSETEEDETTLVAGVGGNHRFTNGFFLSDAGAASFVAVSCNVSAAPLILPHFAVREVSIYDRLAGTKN